MEGYWKVYFLTQHKEYDKFLERLAGVCDRAVFYFHPGGKKDPDRPHIHGLLYKCSKTDKTIREWCRTEFGLAVNEGQYAVSRTYKKQGVGSDIKMSDLTYPGYVTYMSKGKYDPVYSKDFSTEETILAKSLWVEPKKDEPVNIVIEPKEKVIKKLTQWGVAREAEIEYIMRYPDEVIENYCPKKMARVVIDICQKNKILTHKVLVRNILQDIESVISPERFVEMVVRMA